MNVLDIILLIVGAFQIIFSFINNTSNIEASIIYRVIPFFSGCYCVFYSVLNSGIIKFS